MEDRKLTQPPVPIILDTDIGPDCDDAGALALALVLERMGEAALLAVMHCTSSVWGPGCIGAMTAYFGRAEIPVGTLKSAGFLTGEEYEKYNRYLCLHFPTPYPPSAEVPDAVRLYRSILCGRSDREAVVVAIGPLTNLARLLRSGPDDLSPLTGRQLVEEKVRLLAGMGGAFPCGKEWNFESDPEAADTVVRTWPTPMVFSGFEIGNEIQTGGVPGPETLPVPLNPLRAAYRLFTGGPPRMSWDLTAVLYAVRGLRDFWSLEAPGEIEVDAEGGNRWRPASAGRAGYLKRKKDPLYIAEELDGLLGRFHTEHA